MSSLSTPTHYHPNKPESNLIIDLTLLNYSAIDAWPKFNWECKVPESTKSISSDHMAITWTIFEHDQDRRSTSASLDPEFILDPALEEEWIEKYINHIESHDLPSQPDTPKDADRIAGAILEAMSTTSNTVFKQCMKKGKGPVHSPWWTDACSEALHNLKCNPDNCNKDQLCATLQSAIRMAHHTHADCICTEITSSKVFDILKWFTGKCHSLMPPIKTNGPIAMHPHLKAEAFLKQFFPSSSSPLISLEPLGIPELLVQHFQPITADKIIASLLQTSNKSAPGAFGSNY
ncbi:hypothetical protein OPQ81_002497 [Rhizoctonia solani]|nr:hypothetical protein OPQ81_002497 [Rhizoctonia solani]